MTCSVAIAACSAAGDSSAWPGPACCAALGSGCTLRRLHNREIEQKCGIAQKASVPASCSKLVPGTLVWCRDDTQGGCLRHLGSAAKSKQCAPRVVLGQLLPAGAAAALEGLQRVAAPAALAEALGHARPQEARLLCEQSHPSGDLSSLSMWHCHVCLHVAGLLQEPLHPTIGLLFCNRDSRMRPPI